MTNRLIIFLTILIYGCTSTDIEENQIKADFSREFPTYKFNTYSISDKDEDTLKIEVRFQKPTDEKTWVDFWTYEFRDKKWNLEKTGKKRIINPLEEIDRTTVEHAMLQLRPRHIKIDSIIYTKDTFMIDLGSELVFKVLYQGKVIKEPTYIPEGDSVILIYQRHLGNLNAKNYRPE